MKASGRISASAAATDGARPDSSPSPDTVRRHRLQGPSVPLDPTRDAFRRDLADIALAGRVVASHFAEPLVRRAKADADVRAGRELDAEIVCSLGAGDAFAILDIGGGTAWGYCLSDHRVGYVPVDALA